MKKYILLAFVTFLSIPQLSNAQQNLANKTAVKAKEGYRTSVKAKEGYKTYWRDRPKGSYCGDGGCGSDLAYLCNPWDQLTGAGGCYPDGTGQCECEINPQCTTVIIDYESGSHWYASAWYFPCGQSDQSTFHANSWSGNTVSIVSGSTFSIGIAGSKNSLLEVKPTGDTYHITCGGSTTSSANCSPTNLAPIPPKTNKKTPPTK